MMTRNPSNHYMLCHGIPKKQRIVVNLEKAIDGTFVNALTCDKEICKICEVQRKHVMLDELCADLSLSLFIYLYMKEHETIPNRQKLIDYRRGSRS